MWAPSPLVLLFYQILQIILSGGPWVNWHSLTNWDCKSSDNARWGIKCDPCSLSRTKKRNVYMCFYFFFHSVIWIKIKHLRKIVGNKRFHRNTLFICLTSSCKRCVNNELYVPCYLYINRALPILILWRQSRRHGRALLKSNWLNQNL